MHFSYFKPSIRSDVDIEEEFVLLSVWSCLSVFQLQQVDLMGIRIKSLAEIEKEVRICWESIMTSGSLFVAFVSKQVFSTCKCKNVFRICAFHITL